MAVFENWQKANASVKERSFFLFNNDLISDVRLVVGASSHENEAKKRKIAIPAHKCGGGGQGGGRPGEKGVGGVREAGEEGAGSGRKREKLRNIA